MCIRNKHLFLAFIYKTSICYLIPNLSSVCCNYNYVKNIFLTPTGKEWEIPELFSGQQRTRLVQKKDRTFVIKTLFCNILSTVPFKVAPSTGDTPFSTFLPLLECFLEHTICDGAQFSYCIFLNLRVLKKNRTF